MRGREQPDMIRRKFGRLLVLSYDVEMSKRRGIDCYLCRCDCDVEKVVSGNSLRTEHIRSCGCLSREIHSKVCREMCKQINQKGESHPSYVHGFISELKEFREQIHTRDKICQHNGEHKGRFEAHHLDGNRYNNDPKNGALLCHRHHVIVTNNNNIWRPNYDKLDEFEITPATEVGRPVSSL